MTPLSECLREEDTLQEACRQLLVVARPPPILTRDCELRGAFKDVHIFRAIAEGQDPAAIRVSEMEPELRPHNVSVAYDRSIAQVQQTMETEGVDQVLVKEGKDVIGVVATGDVETYTYKAPDGLAFPPPELMRLVGHHQRRRIFERFYSIGAQWAARIRALLADQGVDIAELEAILDFGCGCGRTIRHWKELDKPKIYGCDYNPAPIDWCRQNLPFGEFVNNDVGPPLPFPDESFDFAYALSVFTHLMPDLQSPWIGELRRVMKPGGVLLVSVVGAGRAKADLDAENHKRFLAGELVVREPGSEERLVYHPERYIYETLARELSVLTFLPSPGSHRGQDIVLFGKTADQKT
jgi:SAM-dependent methyltransferase